MESRQGRGARGEEERALVRSDKERSKGLRTTDAELKDSTVSDSNNAFVALQHRSQDLRVTSASGCSYVACLVSS